ncbi:peptidoglycan-binding domain-containing protein [Bryobacter aggregatus]|uniref:peptidoglycan-binding domain-containing protein n=1 Tax=Bryobacter aggregatus TaxID=360054 RepID=UPI0009B5B81F|nr:peptidoglycan-binding domain-containing protein [Bryobacter aggregatus]
MVITRPVVTVLAVCLAGSFGLHAKPVAPKAKQTAAKARTTTKYSASRPAAKGNASAKRVVTPRLAPPMTPGADRIREVQQALLDRGYLRIEPNGIWNAESIDALKRFEADQNVKVDGKLDSKMLIALGLGPKYDSDLSLPVPGVGGTVVAGDHGQSDQQRD